MDESGGQVAVLQAVLTVPPEAFEVPTTVELCAFAPTGDLVSDLVTVGPSDLVFAIPLTLSIGHTGDASAALWTPASDGASGRNLLAVAVDPTTLEGPIFRPGDSFVELDPRIVSPYAESRLLDVLFVIDNSCSMADEQAKLAQIAPSFLGTLVDAGVDFHLGVTSTDLDVEYPSSKGTFRPVDGFAYVDTATPSPETIFAEMTALGTVGSGAEKGIGAAWLSINGAAPAGFLRPEADLSVVVVSDEPDFTPAGLVSDEDFVDWFEDLRPSREQTELHALVDGSTGEAYVDAATETGGWFQPVFDPWDDFFADVVDAAPAAMTFDPPSAWPGDLEVWNVPTDGAEPARLVEGAQFERELDPITGALVRLFVDADAADDPTTASFVVLYVP